MYTYMFLRRMLAVEPTKGRLLQAKDQGRGEWRDVRKLVMG